MVKKIAIILTLLFANVASAASNNLYNLGNVGITTGVGWYFWQQPVGFYTNPDGSVLISGSFNRAVPSTSGPQLWFQTNQANGTMYSSSVTFPIPNGPNNTDVTWQVTIPASAGFAGGDRFGAFLYDNSLNIIGATGATDPYQWIKAPSTIAPLPNQ